MSAFPSTLPRPTVAGYGLQLQSAVQRTEMESGPARVRRRFTATPTRVPVRWVFSAAELALFEAWFERGASAGAAWFDVPLCNGSGSSIRQARFVDTGEPYKVAMIDSNRSWEVTATLETRSMPRLDDWQYRLALNPDLAAGSTPTLALDFVAGTYQQWTD